MIEFQCLCSNFDFYFFGWFSFQELNVCLFQEPHESSVCPSSWYQQALQLVQLGNLHPTPHWGIIIAIKAETSISKEQNFHIAIKSALIFHEVWVVNILHNVLNFKTLDYYHRSLKSEQIMESHLSRVLRTRKDSSAVLNRITRNVLFIRSLVKIGKYTWDSEMAQWPKTPVTKSDNLNSVSEPIQWKKGTDSLKKAPWPLHEWYSIHPTPNL